MRYRISFLVKTGSLPTRSERKRAADRDCQPSAQLAEDISISDLARLSSGARPEQPAAGVPAGAHLRSETVCHVWARVTLHTAHSLRRGPSPRAYALAALVRQASRDSLSETGIQYRCHGAPQESVCDLINTLHIYERRWPRVVLKNHHVALQPLPELRGSALRIARSRSRTSGRAWSIALLRAIVTRPLEGPGSQSGWTTPQAEGMGAQDNRAGIKLAVRRHEASQVVPNSLGLAIAKNERILHPFKRKTSPDLVPVLNLTPRPGKNTHHRGLTAHPHKEEL